MDSPEKAEQIADELERASQALTAEDVKPAAPRPLEEAAAAVAGAAASAPPEHKAEEIIAETAREVVATAGRERAALEEAVQEVFTPEQQDAQPGRFARQRRYLREAILRRMAPYDVVDARLFLAINHLPHTRPLNGFFYFLTTIFNGGMAWFGLMGIALLLDRPHGWRVSRHAAVPLALASSIVEYPVKSFFHRRRPFIRIIQAIVIGKKPGTWSFPSGHAATAFAGAWLMQRHYPRGGVLWYVIAGLVAFSRVYLGDHYPGDVVSGSFMGVALAAAITGLRGRLWRLARRGGARWRGARRR
jgi:undecaprenyl-diphosphatase